MIPDFDSNGNLPPGVHEAGMAEVGVRFTQNAKRRALFVGLEKVVNILQEAGCPEIYLDGSFVTKKEEPADYDLCYEPTGLQVTESLREFLINRENRKTEFLGDIFVRMPEPPYHTDYVKVWQQDGRQDGVAKGILRIDLRAKKDAQE